MPPRKSIPAVVFATLLIAACGQEIASKASGTAGQIKQMYEDAEEKLRRAKAYARQLDDLRRELEARHGYVFDDAQEILATCGMLPPPDAHPDEFRIWADNCKFTFNNLQSKR